MRLWQLLLTTWAGLQLVILVFWQGFWQHVRAEAARLPNGHLMADSELLAPSEIPLDAPIAGEPAKRRTR